MNKIISLSAYKQLLIQLRVLLSDTCMNPNYTEDEKAVFSQFVNDRQRTYIRAAERELSRDESNQLYAFLYMSDEYISSIKN